MPALRTAEKSIRATDLRAGDRISAWTVEWSLDSYNQAHPTIHHVLRGVVQRTTDKSVWVHTGSRVMRFGLAGLLARGAWRSPRYEGEVGRR
jgi:hypothetical protein